MAQLPQPPATQPPPIAVGALIKVVPDGRHTGGGQDVARISLVLMPDPRPADAQLDLNDWPKAIAQCLDRGISIVVGRRGQPLQTIAPGKVRIVNRPRQPERATRLWRRVFDRNGQERGSQLPILRNALLQQLLAVGRLQNLVASNLPLVMVRGATDYQDFLQDVAAEVSRQTVGGQRLLDTRAADAVPHPMAFGRTVVLESLRTTLFAALAGSPGRADRREALRGQAEDATPEEQQVPAFLAKLRAQQDRVRDSARTNSVLDSVVPAPAQGSPPIPRPLDALLRTIRTDRPAAFWGRTAAPAVDQRFDSSNTTEQFGDLNLAEVGLQHRLATGAISYVGRGPDGDQIRTLLRDRPFATDEGTQSVQKKFTGLMSRPALATELGLIVDVEVDWSDIRSTLGPGAPTLMDDLLVGAQFVQEVSADNQILTATEISPLTTHPEAGSPTYFGPTSRYRAGRLDLAVAPGEGSSLKSGFLDLTVHSSANPVNDRYILSSFDNYSGFERLQNAVIDMVQRIMQGLEPNVDQVPTPELRTLGLSVLDSCRKIALQQEQETANETYEIDGKTYSLLHAEELLAGFRFDVQVTTRASGTFWQSLTERIVSFDDPLAGGVALPPGLEGRDDGYSRPITKNAENGQDVSVAFETLAVWGGASLAVPPRVGQKRDGAADPEYDDGQQLISEHDAARELAVDTVIEVPERHDRRRPDASGLAALRFSKQYRIAARCAWINGGGHSLRQAEPIYRDGKFILGAAQVTGDPAARPAFVHRRYEEIPPPMLLLSEQDRLVVLEDRELARFPGELADRLVLRPGDSVARPVRRWLIPPRTSIDLAEQHGVLDVLDSLSTGALGSFERDPLSGRFPDALGGARRTKLDYFDPQAKGPDGKYKFRQGGTKTGELIVSSRGSVLRKGGGRGPTSPDKVYLPDPLAEVLFIRLTRDGRLAAGGVPGARPLQHVIMNRREGWPRQAQAVALDLVPLESGARGEWNVETVVEDSRTTIRVKLAPGEELDLDLWCGTRTAEHLSDHWLVHRVVSNARPMNDLLNRLRSLRMSAQETSTVDDVKAEADAIFHALHGTSVSDAERREQLALVKGDTHDAFLEHMNTARIPHLSGLRTVKLVHPVRKPLGKPVVAMKGSPAKLQFHPVRIVLDRTPSDGAISDPVELMRIKWFKFVETQGGLAPSQPVTPWESEAGATCAFFIGSVDVHRQTTRDLHAIARWTDWVDDATTVVRDANGGFVFKPAIESNSPERELFAIKGLRQKSEVGAATEVDLGLDNDAGSADQLRYLSYDFGNTRARRLSIHFAAHARFDRFYPAKDEGNGDVPTATFRTESTVHGDIWIKSTRRPAAPVLTRGRETLPAFHFHSEKLLETDKKTVRGFAVTREGRVRVHLDRPWYDTGEGELLAVVIGPPTLFPAQLDVCPVPGDRGVSDDQLAEFAAMIDTDIEPFLSRRGHDPIRISGDYPDALLAPADIGRCTLRAGSLKMPYTPLTDDRTTLSKEAAGTVAIAGFKPELDPVNGDHWFCDLPIVAGPSYWPFVRLGLVRWQPNAIVGHELSTPVTTWAQIPAERRAEVTFEKASREMEDRLVTLRVTGQGFDEANFGKHYDRSKFARDMRPFLDVRLVRADDRDPPTLGTDRGWTPVIDPSTGSAVIFRAVPAEVKDGKASWAIAIALPRSRKELHYALLIEEYTMMPADDAVNDRKEPILHRGHVTYASVLDFKIAET